MMAVPQTKCGLPTKAAWKVIQVKMRLLETDAEGPGGWRWECSFGKVWLQSPEIYAAAPYAKAAAVEWLNELDDLPRGAVFLPEWVENALDSPGSAS